MTRHISDQPRSRGNARLREFLRQQRQEGTHPAISALHMRAQGRHDDSRKAGEYLRIARGRLA